MIPIPMENLITAPHPDSAGSDSSTPSCSSSTSYFQYYDVFINHRGPDVKDTLASDLYRRLISNGLRVFLDREVLEEGFDITSQIKDAIRVASVHVAIFSPTYAESPWCLDELVLMVNSGAIILPVFYKVEPSVVRWTAGAYGEALHRLQAKTTLDIKTGVEKPRYDSNTIQNWRNALSHVADKCGFVLHGNEVELLDKVVQSVFKNVPKKLLDMPRYPTGLDLKLQEFQTMVLSKQQETERVEAKVVGVVGIRGVGKTTLAKEYFNRKSSCYTASSFLSDVREDAARRSLNHLQSKLIQDLKHIDTIVGPHEGIGMLKKHLLSCHGLVILDDVDHVSQLEAFLPIKNILSPDSLILITSRDKNVLKSSGVLEASIYNLEGLNTLHSKELFCSYAFNKPLPAPGFEDLADLFVTACDGLPLSLKEFGALVCGINDKHYWEELLDSLRQTLPVENAHNLEDKRERSSAFLNESHIVGIKGDIDKITEFILKEKGPQVIAVVGMGGMGKTLLVERVFKSRKVQERFDHVVWLAVPQNFDMQHLLPEIKKKMKIDDTVRNPDLTMDNSRAEILKVLETSRCLLVLDDIWNKDDFHKFSWLLGKTKIIVTTRHKQVVSSISDQQLECYFMKYLSPENSKKLFCIHAFPDRGHTQQSTADTDMNLPNYPPKELITVTDQIVRKCGGLPLAVKAIGASMARVRRLTNDWESILKCLNEAAATSYEVWPSLRLSYQELPYHLKLFFDYCSSFPKNSPIKSEYLVNAWIAEGFIPRTTENPYDVGLSYIEELIDRCLLEVSKVGGDGRVKYCKMNGLLLELAHSETHKKTKCLLKPGNELKEFPVDQSVGLRRISLIRNNISTILQPINCKRLRTLLLCNNLSLEQISPSFFNDMEYLAVLDLSDTSIKLLPETVGQLKHLKLLNLSRTKIEKLPKSLAELKRLQFLDVSQCEDLREMHSGIGEHKSMLHLNVKGSGNLESLPVGISKLIYLHTLKGVVFKSEKAPTAKSLQLSVLLKRGKAANAKALHWWDLKGLTLLRHLSLTLESEGSILLEEGIFASMTNMRALSFKYVDSSKGSRGILQLPKDIEVMRHLEILHLKNCVMQDWIFRLENLMELELYGDNGSTPDYIGLEKIPNLRKLKLSSNYNDQCVEFPQEFGKSGAFPKLENFVIKRFNKMENFPLLQDGALPMLKCLQMKLCNKLRDITKALQRPTSILEEIRVKGCQEWVDSIWKDESTWQLLKDSRIKLTINGHIISWASSQFDNFKLYANNEERKKIRSSLLICEAAVRFTEVGTSSAQGAA